MNYVVEVGVGNRIGAGGCMELVVLSLSLSLDLGRVAGAGSLTEIWLSMGLCCLTRHVLVSSIRKKDGQGRTRRGGPATDEIKRLQRQINNASTKH